LNALGLLPSSCPRVVRERCVHGPGSAAAAQVEALRNYRQPMSIGRRGIVVVDRLFRRRKHLSRLRLDPEYYFIARR
jgi:hypothetical protein